MSVSTAAAFRSVLENEGLSTKRVEVEDTGKLVVVLNTDDVLEPREDQGIDGISMTVAAYWGFYPGSGVDPLKIRVLDYDAGQAAFYTCRGEWAAEVAETIDAADDESAISTAKGKCLRRVHDTEKVASPKGLREREEQAAHGD
ncbi:hypothetical protein SAMN04488063_0017 [Halopelagius inordinatus]|uniref:Uncharacterized protein n=1 Tax=Halopelagius inordinatus TaxID=553467 RepID=A0A1I2WVD7_9EURY|nr:hypothetical protein [Halopelagius inordinatus]SFH05263.1 hypothetical protein SAMN04488063_0017 [Halopelagius inordinatus]